AHDAVTLDVTGTTDTNGTVRGTTYDGFGRVTRSKVMPPGGADGVLSATTYSGFELVDTNGDGIPDTTAALKTGAGRSIAQKTFQDAVPCPSDPSTCDANVATTAGRITTAVLDSYGRVNTAKADLGTSYPNKVVVSTSYDALGRISFKSDPYEDNGSGQTPYGTTYNYNSDGTPSCFVRGPGVQAAFFLAGDETAEIYPTCFGRNFDNHQEILMRQDPDTLPADAGGGRIFKQTINNAVGRTV